MFVKPDRPGRMVRKSASGLTCAAVMPYARSSCAVATYTAPFQFRPDVTRWSEESVVSSWTMSPDPSEAAMPRASAAIAASWAPVKVPHPPGSCRHGAPGVLGAACG